MPVSDVYVMHDRLRAAYEKLSELDGQYRRVRGEMDGLVKLGDMVDPDDVVKAAGRLVGHGLGAESIAEIMATMPPNGGQPLAAWVQQQDQRFGVMEQQLAGMKDGIQHQLLVAGVRVLAAEHIIGPQGPQPSKAPSNGLAPEASPGPSNALNSPLPQVH